MMTLIDITLEGVDTPYRPYTWIATWRKLPSHITINKTTISRYQVPSIVEYINVENGEIIKADRLKNDPRIPPPIYVGEIMLRRRTLMNSLRKEVRDFAYFVLQFRNNRRGITPAIDMLVEWYARLHNKRVSNVKRYVTFLEEAGFLAGSSLLSPLFQRTGKRTVAKDHLGEDFAAATKFMIMRQKAKSLSQCRHVGHKCEHEC